MQQLNPNWNDEFQFELLNEREDLTLYFHVYDWDRLTSDDRRFLIHIFTIHMEV